MPDHDLLWQPDDGFPLRNLHAWKEQTLADCKVKMFPGNHFFIHDARDNFIETLRNDVVSSMIESQQSRKKLPQMNK